jgi:hypothetical protein
LDDHQDIRSQAGAGVQREAADFIQHSDSVVGTADRRLAVPLHNGENGAAFRVDEGPDHDLAVEG